MKKKPKGTPSGFRDLLPEETLLKEFVVQTISTVYKKYGFVPLETPIVEFAETLMGEVTDFNLFMVVPSKTRERGEADPLALRFDQTVPLARFIAQNPQIQKPFKRYVYGPVFRGERPQSGRYRQFDQFDADTVGTSNISSDIEIILMMNEVLSEIGIEKFLIKVNTRKILNALPFVYNFPQESLRPVLIALDKRDKISQEELKNLLLKEDISESSADKLIEFGAISGNPSEVISTLISICESVPEAQEGLSDLRAIADTLDSLSIRNTVLFDMSIIRGLGYYTGTIFETQLVDAPEFGSVYSGGRYDNLVENFGVAQQPAVGASVGVDRLVAALIKIDFVPKNIGDKAIVLIQDAEVLPYAFTVANEIRTKGISCEVYTGNKKKIGDQFAYASSQGYTYACIVGSSEKDSNTVSIKNMKSKEQSVQQINSITL